MVAVRDVTDQRRAERFHEVERVVSDALAGAQDIHEAGPAILEAACTACGWPRAEIWLAGPEPDVLALAAQFPDDGDRPAPPRPADALTLAACRTGTPVWTCDPVALEEPASRPRPRAGLAVPAPRGGKVLAVLSFFAAEVDGPADPLIALLSGIATQIAEFQERRRAEELAAALDRSKDDYLALIGHELRTPLTSIVAYVEMLREADPDAVAEELPGLLDVLSRNSAALRQIIDQLLDLAALDRGLAELAREPICLASVVRAAVEAAHPVATAAGVGMTLDLRTGKVITGDAVRIRQMTDQLLGNAIKHTPGGGQVTVALTSPGPTAVELTVTDTGLGIPDGERERLFAPLHRTERSRRHGIAGNGLGLAVARAIVESHQGTIRLVPTTAPGSRVVVRLPVPAEPQV